MATAITISAPATSTNINGGYGTFTLTAQVSAPNTALQISSYTFTSATGIEISSPTGAQCAIVIPPVSNAEGITLSGDSQSVHGIAISPSQPTGPITFATNTGVSNFYLTSAGAITGPVQVVFY